MINKIVTLYKTNKEIVNYLIVGVLTTIINLLSKYGLLFFAFDIKNAKHLEYSIIISWIISVVFAYFANRKMVFQSNSNNIILEFFKFVGARIATLLLEMVYMWFFITYLKLDTKLWVILISVFCQLLIIIFNYIFSKIFVFKVKGK